MQSKTMKTISFSAVIGTLLSLCCLAGLSSCASMDASNQEALLSAAGFRVKTPSTPQQQAAYAAAPSYKVHRATVNGRTFYAYKDEDKGVAYVGGDDEYQRYQQLAIQKKIAQDNYSAAQMNQASAMNWYGAWGYGGYRYGAPGRFWW